MVDQIFGRIKKTLAVLVFALFVVSVTAAAATAGGNYYGDGHKDNKWYDGHDDGHKYKDKYGWYDKHHKHHKNYHNYYKHHYKYKYHNHH